MTDRAGRWVTEQVGRYARTVNEVAVGLGCDWHTINDTVIAYGTALVDDDPLRYGIVHALGLDEVLFVRLGLYHRQHFTTSIVDVEVGQLLDIVPDRSGKNPAEWIEAKSLEWRDQVRWATLDLSGPYRAVFDRDSRTPPRWPIRFMWSSSATPSSTRSGGGCRTRPWATGATRTTPSTGAGDCSPRQPSASTKVVAPSCSGCCGPVILTGKSRPPGTQKKPCASSMATPTPHWPWSARTAGGRHEGQRQPARSPHSRADPAAVEKQIVAWHRLHVTNGSTESTNNLIKRVKRGAFGFTSFRNYRIRSLLYAGKPRWALLATITPAEIRSPTKIPICTNG